MKHILLSRAAFVACAIFVAGCAHGDAPAAPRDACAVARASRVGASTSIPFELVNGRIYVEARVNGQGPFRFAVDTGASGFGRADSTLVSALGLAVTGRAETSDGVSTASVNTVRLDALQLGEIRREGIDVITRDYGSNLSEEARFAGILARDFFADGLLIIDFPAQRLTFTDAVGLSPDHAGALSYERPFRIPVTIGERAVIANLDTGAGVTLVLPRTLWDEVGSGPLEPAGRGRLTNNVIDTYRGVVPGPLRAGGASFSNIEARVADRFPEALIGGEALRDLVVAIDQRSQVVAMCPAA